MFRHTAATLLIEEGTNLRFVQRLLGHQSISTTEIYTHVTDTSLKTALLRANPLGRMRL
jgi:integrase/recombinase XerD